jgi:hypothetical protein
VAKTEMEKDSHSTGPTGPTGAWQDDEACEHGSACVGEDEAGACGAVAAGVFESVRKGRYPGGCRLFVHPGFASYRP